MSMKHSIALTFEIDKVNQNVTFHNVNSWSAFIKQDKMYTYNECVNDILKYIMDYNEQDIWKHWISEILKKTYMNKKSFSFDFKGVSDKKDIENYRFIIESIDENKIIGSIEKILQIKRRNKQRRHFDFLWARQKKKIVICFMVSIVILTSITAAGIRYLSELQELMIDETYTYLDEISTQLSGNVEKFIFSMQKKTETLRNVIEEDSWESTKDIEVWLDSMLELQDFSKLYLMDETGAWYADGKRNQQLFLRDFSIDVGIRDKVRMSSAQNIGGSDYLVLGVPLDIQTKDGKTYIGLIAAISPKKMNEQLSLNAFDNIGYAHIVTNDGRTILRSNNENSDFTGYSLFSVLSNANLKDGTTINTLTQRMQNNEVVRIHFDFNNRDKLAILNPIGIEEWYLCSILPTSFVYEKSNLFIQLTTVICIVIALILLSLVIAIMMIQEKGKRKLEQSAYVDQITGGHTLLKFEQLVAYCIFHQQASAMIYLNIVGFKAYNDRLGRERADRILKTFEYIIEKNLNKNEYVCRVMADHFAILIDEDNVENMMMRIRQWLNETNNVWKSTEQQTLNINITCGIYFIDDEKLDVPQMIDRANLARQAIHHKNIEGISYCLYDEELKKRIERQQELELHQQTALDNGEFLMHLQPKYSVSQHKIVGAEALVRWNNKEEGMIYPSDFIPLFENNGFITKIDIYIFEKACQWIQNVIDLGLTPIPVSINLSRRCFDTKDFLKAYEEIWKKYNFPANLLELEFTESVFYDHLDHFRNIISQIHKIGFRCSMDDFGSGYSSLNILGNLPLDTIKIDRMFFNNLDQNLDENMKTTIEYAVRMVKKLGMQVVAEGVEDQQQLKFLEKIRCDIVQGYVFSKPIPSEQLLQKMKEDN